MIEIKLQPDIPDAVIELNLTGPGKDGYTPQRGVDYWTEEDKREMRSFSAGALISEESGEQVAIHPDAESPIRLQVKLTPVQPGVPSADNVVPITGRSEVRISRYGVNLFDAGFEKGTINSTTGVDNASGVIVRSDFIAVVPDRAYAFSRSITTNTMAIRCYDADKNYLGTGSPVMKLLEGKGVSNPMGTGDAQATVQFKDGVRYIRVVDFAGNLSTQYQMELGDTVTPYQPVQREDLNFSFGQNVFGGELDVNHGVLMVTHGEIASYNGETLPGEWLSDRDVYAEDAVPTIGAQVVYALAEPYEVIVNAVDLNARDGINTFAVIDGMMDVTYNQRLDNAINQIYEAIGNGGSGGSGGAVASVNGKTGRVILNAEDVGALPNIPASSEGMGGVKVGKNLIIDETGALSVDTASSVEEDNTRPITSAAVHATVGNIEILLGTI